jgi:hypothetical protein
MVRGVSALGVADAAAVGAGVEAGSLVLLPQPAATNSRIAEKIRSKGVREDLSMDCMDFFLSSRNILS